MCKNLESGNFQTMKTYIQREEDFRPMYSHENFKNVSFVIFSSEIQWCFSIVKIWKAEKIVRLENW